MPSRRIFDVLPIIRRRTLSEVHKIDAMLAQFCSLDEYEFELRHVVCRVLDRARSVAPSAMASIRQFGFAMHGELFSSATSLAWIDTMPQPDWLQFETSEFKIAPMLLHLMFPVLDDHRTSRCLQIDPRGEASLLCNNDDRKCVLPLSMLEVEYLGRLTSLGPMFEQFEDFKTALDDWYLAFSSAQPAIANKLRAIATPFEQNTPDEHRDGRMAIWTEAVANWERFQISTHCEHCFVHLEPVLAHGHGIGVFWAAMENPSTDSLLAITTMGHAFMRDLYELEYSAAIRSQWASSAAEAIRRIHLHDLGAGVAALKASLYAIKREIGFENNSDFPRLFASLERGVALVEKSVDNLNDESVEEVTGIWTVDPEQFVTFLKRFLVGNEVKKCAFVYPAATRIMHQQVDAGEVISAEEVIWTSNTCQMPGPPEDLAAAIFGMIRNAIEASERASDWDYSGVAEHLRIYADAGLTVEGASTTAVVLASILPNNMGLQIRIKDGGSGIPDDMLKTVCDGSLLRRGPSVKPAGGLGLRRSLVAIKNRFNGNWVYTKEYGWVITIPGVQWSFPTRPDM